MRVIDITTLPKEATLPRRFELYAGWRPMYITLVVAVIAFAYTGQGHYAIAALVSVIALQVAANLLTFSWRQECWHREYERAKDMRARRDAS